MNNEIVLAPMQGFTDSIFRNVFADLFEGVDYAVMPYIKTSRSREFKHSDKREILPENNRKIRVIPQILSNQADDFILLAEHLFQMGYGEINWNMGCPYPMAAKKKLGSGILEHPDLVYDFLSKVTSRIPNRLSVKMRLGYKAPDEIFRLLPLMDGFPLTSITIHPRIGKQIYKGSVDLDTLEKCLPLTRHQVIYNGDICHLRDFQDIAARFPEIQTWMIGRGILQNPFLPAQIKGLAVGDRREKLRLLHSGLMDKYSELMDGEGHVLQHMRPYWGYLAEAFEESRKITKMIKKARSLNHYKELVDRTFEEMALGLEHV